MIKFTKDSFVHNLARGKLLVPYLDRYDKYDQPFEFQYTLKIGDDAWHPSGDCLPSVQELYDKATGVVTENSHSPSLQKAFLVGHFWHQVIQNVLMDMEFAQPEDIERRGYNAWGGSPDPKVLEFAKPYHWVTGAGDVVPLKLPGGWEGVLDIKTMNSRDWNDSFKSGLLPLRWADKYEAQVNIYMEFFNQDHAMILAVNKDAPHGYLEFVFDRNQPLIDAIFNKWKYVSTCLDSGTPPSDDVDYLSRLLPFTGPAG